MMPQSSQNLYFHLGMNADDDGYCEYFGILRMTDSKPDDLKILQAKGFVTIFDDLVLLLKDWKEHNYIRPDTFTPSKYLDIYPIVSSTSRLLNVYVPSTQDKISKDKISKDKESTSTAGTQEVRFSSKGDITSSILEELAEKNQVSVEFVGENWDTAQNWLLAKGKVMKDYRAFLDNWVRREKANINLESRRNNNSFQKRGGVLDARTK